jgi:glutamate racemase
LNKKPIAVFDSGMGGLSVLRELRALMPRESMIYFGDGKNCPYGSKPREEVVGFVDAAARFLIGEKGAKMLVIACNAATAAAIDFLRGKYSVPVVGMEPAVKPAALSTETGVIGILATRGTLDGALFRDTAARWADKVEILQGVGEGFVELVEQGREDTPQAEQAVRRALEPMLRRGADRIVLGCTHYPFLEPVMRRVIDSLSLPRKVEIIDPAPAVALHAQSLLDKTGSLADPAAVPRYEFHTAAGEDYLARLIAKIDYL